MVIGQISPLLFDHSPILNLHAIISILPDNAGER